VTRISRQIPIPSMEGTGRDFDRVQCAWADCDNPASGLHTAVECMAAAGVRNHDERPRRPECSQCRRVAFCSVQCASYYTRSHRPGQYGKLPPGVAPRWFLT
jgi:hypothetical protein